MRRDGRAQAHRGFVLSRTAVVFFTGSALRGVRPKNSNPLLLQSHMEPGRFGAGTARFRLFERKSSQGFHFVEEGKSRSVSEEHTSIKRICR